MQTIQGASGTLFTIDVDNVYLIVKALQSFYHDIVLIGVLRYPILFTNQISASYF